MRPYLLSLAGCVVLGAAAFLPWLRLGAVGLPGVPDPAGFFVLALGGIGTALSLLGLLGRRETRTALFLVGLAGLTTLAAVWLTGPALVAERAELRAQAVALVDNVAPTPPPPVTIGVGLVLGAAGAALTAAVGLAGAVALRR
jgi:hypothetical protein